MHDDAPEIATDDEVEAAAEEMTPDEAVYAAVNQGREQRLWLKALVPLLQLRRGDSDPSDRVQLALDFVAIAAAERICRLCRSDMWKA
jgi:hypothetical protein